MNTKELLIKLFGDAVVSKSKTALPSLYNTEFESVKSLFDRKEFDRLLVKTDLENHTETLWELGLSVTVTLHDDSNFKIEASSNNDCMIGLTKTLLFLMENVNNDSINIKLSEAKTFITVTNKFTVDVIRKCLLSVYKDYIQTEDINIEYLKSKLEYFETYQSAIIDNKKGAPLKNCHIAYILQQILPLLSYKTTNKNFRLIFEYCKFFKLINEESISEFQQIKSIYKYYKDIIQKSE
jgi:hypothetical protein